jgi:hypothetical protein
MTNRFGKAVQRGVEVKDRLRLVGLAPVVQGDTCTTLFDESRLDLLEPCPWTEEPGGTPFNRAGWLVSWILGLTGRRGTLGPAASIELGAPFRWPRVALRV